MRIFCPAIGISFLRSRSPRTFAATPTPAVGRVATLDQAPPRVGWLWPLLDCLTRRSCLYRSRTHGRGAAGPPQTQPVYYAAQLAACEIGTLSRCPSLLRRSRARSRI